MVELVHDHTDGPSVVHDVFPPGTSGLHHLAYIVDDVPGTIRTLVDRGHELAMSARTANGTEFHFVDALATHGHFLELYPHQRAAARVLRDGRRRRGRVGRHRPGADALTTESATARRQYVRRWSGTSSSTVIATFQRGRHCLCTKRHPSGVRTTTSW